MTKYLIEVKFAGSDNDVWRHDGSLPDHVGVGQYYDGSKLADGKQGADHYLSPEERVAQLSPEDRVKLGRGRGVHAGSAGKIKSSDVLVKGYCYGLEGHELERSLDPEKIHDLPGGVGEVLGRNVFYGRRQDQVEVNGQMQPVQVLSYSVGGAAKKDGSFLKGSFGHMEEQELFMLAEMEQQIQEILRSDPNAEIEVEIRGHSRGGVSAAMFERDFHALYPQIHINAVQFDPVPGGIQAFNRGYEEHVHPGQGPVHPFVVEQFQAKDSHLVPVGQQAPQAQKAVIYALDCSDPVKAFFTPQEVMGADVVIISPEDHDLYQKRAQLRGGQVGLGGYEVEIDGQWQHIKGEDVGKLPKGLWVVIPDDEKGLILQQVAPPPDADKLSTAELRSYGDKIIEAMGGVKGAGRASNRHDVIRNVIMNALNPNYKVSEYGQRAESAELEVDAPYGYRHSDESPNYGRESAGSPRVDVKHAHRKPIFLENVKRAEQERWVEDIMVRQAVGLDPNSAEVKAALSSVREELLRPDSYDEVKRLHEAYREQDMQLQQQRLEEGHVVTSYQQAPIPSIRDMIKAGMTEKDALTMYVQLHKDYEAAGIEGAGLEAGARGIEDYLGIHHAGDSQYSAENVYKQIEAEIERSQNPEGADIQLNYVKLIEQYKSDDPQNVDIFASSVEASVKPSAQSQEASPQTQEAVIGQPATAQVPPPDGSAMSTGSAQYSKAEQERDSIFMDAVEKVQKGKKLSEREQAIYDSHKDKDGNLQPFESYDADARLEQQAAMEDQPFVTVTPSELTETEQPEDDFDSSYYTI